MEPRTKSALVFMLAVDCFVIGSAAVGAAAAQEAGVGNPAAEASTASAANPEQETKGEPAGAPTLLPIGKTVRVFSLLAEKDDDEDSEGVEGTLVDADENNLRIGRGRRVVTIPRQTIRRLEVAVEGPRPVNRGRLVAGAGIGVGAGLGAGAIAAYLLAGGVSGDPEADVAGPLLIGSALGGFIGGMIAHETRGRAWTEVSRERVHVGLLPAVGRRGFGLTLAVGF